MIKLEASYGGCELYIVMEIELPVRSCRSTEELTRQECFLIF